MHKVLITAGPTREPIDPVRFISNHSTGIFGIEIAKAFLRKKIPTTLVHGPIHMATNLKLKKIPFTTTQDLQKILHKEIPHHTILFMAAAVADFTPTKTSSHKIKRTQKTQVLKLKPTPDILNSLKKFKNNKFYVGFSIESKNPIQNGLKKLTHKNLDLLISHHITDSKSPFGQNSIAPVLIYKGGKIQPLPQLSKRALATRIANLVLAKVGH